MRVTKLFNFITILATIFIMSCSSDAGDPDPNNGNNGNNTNTSPTAITLTSDKSVFDIGGTVNFTVKTNQNVNVSSDAIIKVNGTAITGNSYTPSTHGALVVSATFSNLTSNELSITVNNVITVSSVTLTSDVTDVKAGEIITLNAEVTLSDGTKVDKTNDSEFSIDGVAIVGNKYIAAKVGELKAKAKYNNTASNEVLIQVTDVATPTTFIKKAIIEDYTGTWCGWCPRVSYAIGLVEAQTDKVFTVAAHVANNEPMENDASRALRNAFGVNSFPTAYVNRESVWTYPEPSNIDEAVNQATGNTNVGLAINSVLSGETMNVVVSSGFAENVAGTRLVVFILEDKVVYNQANYTSYYGGADPIVNFEHNHVLRYSATDVLGTPTESSSGVHHTSFSINLGFEGVSDKNNTAVIAMLVNSTGKKVLNAQYAKVGVKKDFD
ncbi:MAG: Omp28-related outer membrane protein [Flavobacteriaceae bacterium]